MAYDAALTYLNEYRTRRTKELNNEQRMHWFTYDSGTLPELFDTTFDSTAENDEWEALFIADTPTSQLEAPRIKVHFLAGCRRDLRMQFAAWSGHRSRNPIDADRYEYMRLGFGNLKMAELQRVTEVKESA